MPNLPKAAWVILAILSALGTIADGMSCGLILMAMIGANNILAQVMVFAGGLMITGLAVATKAVFSEKSGCGLKIIWGIATSIDLYTTIVGTVFYVIIGMPLTAQVDFSMMHFDISNLFPSLIAFGLSAIITGSSVVSLFVIEKLFE